MVPAPPGRPLRAYRPIIAEPTDPCVTATARVDCVAAPTWSNAAV